jgi:hypothetical protein
MDVKFLTFSDFHGKYPDVGSTYIRVNQLLRYWPEAAKYRYGQKPDALIFQKVYVLPDYHFPETFPGIKILDICDPDWLDGVFIKATVDAVDAVTCPTEGLATFLRQLTDKPVVVVPDRFDLAVIPYPRVHAGKAKRVVWFGYRHNIEILKPALPLIARLGLSLTVISNDDPLAWQWVPSSHIEEFRTERYRYVKHDENTFYQELQTCDFAVLPAGNRPVDGYKSNNRWVKSVLAGLPVAMTGDEVERYLGPDARSAYIDNHYDQTRQEYDIRRSVDQYTQLISDIKEERDRAR